MNNNAMTKVAVSTETVLELHKLLALLIDDEQEYGSFLSGRLSESDIFPSLQMERDVLSAILKLTRDSKNASPKVIIAMMKVHQHPEKSIQSILDTRPEGDNRAELIRNQIDIYLYHVAASGLQWANAENQKLIDGRKISNQIELAKRMISNINSSIPYFVKAYSVSGSERMDEAIEKQRKRLRQMMENDFHGPAWCIPELNNVAPPWKTDFSTLFGAYRKTGKSSFAHVQAEYLARFCGCYVLYCGMETDTETHQQRNWSRYLGIPSKSYYKQLEYQSIHTGQMLKTMVDVDRPAYRMWIDLLLKEELEREKRGFLVQTWYRTGATAEDILDATRENKRIANSYGVPLVVMVDYAQKINMQPYKKETDSREQHISMAGDALKSGCEAADAYLILFTQETKAQPREGFGHKGLFARYPQYSSLLPDKYQLYISMASRLRTGREAVTGVDHQFMYDALGNERFYDDGKLSGDVQFLIMDSNNGTQGHKIPARFERPFGMFYTAESMPMVYPDIREYLD